MNWVTAKNTDDFCAYFGNESDNLRKEGVYCDSLFLRLKEKLDNNLDSLFFLKQSHSVDVFVVDDSYSINAPLDLFQYAGDAIISNKKNGGIGVVTADCLSIILHDPKNEAIGVIHAGWRGLSTRIITATIHKMRDAFQTTASNLHAYLGPSAGVCCYEVQNDFLSHFPNTIFEKKIMEKRDGKLFFNQQFAAISELVDNHLPLAAIDVSNTVCTMCTPGFCSARIQKENAGRQPSVAFLHKKGSK